VREDIRLIEEAERLGYTGLALFRRDENYGRADYDQSVDFGQLKHESSIKLLRGVEIIAKNPEEMKKKVQKFRNKADILLVHGGDVKINRAACENPRVDIISRPYQNRRDCGINHVLSKKAAENNVAIELNIRYLSKISSHLRSRVLAQFREILKLQRKFNFPVIITSNAHSIYDLHTPQDIIALSKCFGMEREEAVIALSETPLNIIERKRNRKDVLADGVRIIKESND